MWSDLYLLAALGAVLAMFSGGTLALALAAAIPVVIAWSVLTLHRPSRVAADDDGIVFSAYGRDHRFAWRDVERVHVRRFLLRDRVFVRILPSPPLRGRYWLFDSIGGYDAAIKILEHRSRRHA